MREMKDSGVKWIGEIPADWGLRRLRFLCRIQTGNMDTQDNNPDGAYPFYVRSPIVEHCDSYTFDNEAVLMAGDGVGAGKVFHYVQGKYGCHQRVYSLSDFSDVDGKYLYYYLLENFYKKIEESNAKSTVDSVRLPMLKDFPVVLPNISTQQRIVKFLDEKGSLIDSVIEKQQAIIEKLKVYKLSVITEAVTRGLNPDVEMKDSGVEWIGIGPKHWEYIRAKYKIKITNGSDPQTEGDIPVYGSGENSFKTCGEYKDGPTVLLGRKGTINIPRYISGKYWNIDTAFDVHAKNGYSLKYYYYCACCFDYKFYMSQTTLPSMTQAIYENMKIPTPSLNEQMEIVCFLDSKCSHIDAVIEERQDLVERLVDYKKSLIYEVVTGKKEV